MSSGTIRVIVKEPTKEPEVREVRNSLPALQAIVGGYIEAINLDGTLLLLCNEEGALSPLPPNILLAAYGTIRGNVIVTKANREGDFVSLSAGNQLAATHILRSTAL